MKVYRFEKYTRKKQMIKGRLCWISESSTSLSRRLGLLILRTCWDVPSWYLFQHSRPNFNHLMRKRRLYISSQHTMKEPGRKSWFTSTRFKWTTLGT
ncbi:hypothetical protein X975_20446, partial [Stegodyphus mimosarum]